MSWNRTMTLAQARSRRRWFGWIGAALMLLTAPLLVIGVLKGIYLASRQMPDPLSRAVFGVFANFVAWLYHWAASLLPSITEALWSWAPQLNLGALDASGVASAGFIGAYAVFLLGSYLSGVAYRINVRLTQRLCRVEEMAWEEALRNELRKGVTAEQAIEQMKVTITIVGQDPPWHQRGWGVVLLGLALPLIVKVLEVVLGLSKLP
jgi:hypothetical protein